MAGYVFDEFPWDRREPDPRRERLCDGGRRDPDRLDCRIEGASFSQDEPAPRAEVTVISYNIERGFRADEQVGMLLSDAGMPAPDIILLNEVDRGCSRTAYRSAAREYARRLGMRYVFGVEFIELPRLFGGGRRVRARCEHGNAILSRYPLGNVRQLRFRSNRSWRFRGLAPLFGEPRLGGRMALAADVKLGRQCLRVYSTHLESGRWNGRCRAEQAAELADDGAAAPFGSVIGGDINCGSYLSDIVSGTARDGATQAFFARGYLDAHAGLPLPERTTTASRVVIDLILGRGVTFTAAGVAPRDRWSGLSDHLPVWARLRIDAPERGSQ